MGWAFEFFNSIAKTIPAIARRLGSVMLFFFLLGSLFGYYVVAMQMNPLWLLATPLSIAVMWRDLDDGFFFFLVLVALAVFYPTLI